jgi:YYY domain-containing protein
VCLAANALLAKKTNFADSVLRDSDCLKGIIAEESLFMFLLFYWSYQRGLRPEIIGLEKLMDFGFLNSILRSEYFPPTDVWYAGEPINYYYLGQYFSGFVTRMSFVPSEIAYNLMIATLFALSFMLVYSIAGFLIEIYEANANKPILHVKENEKPFFQKARPIAQLLTGVLVTLGGNLHAPIYAWFLTEQNPYGQYWFPDATRYLGHNPPVGNDETIHEFPLYSYIVADLHAHVINMIFVLTVIGLAVSTALMIMNAARLKGFDRDEKVAINTKSILAFLGKLLPPGFWVIIFLTGLFPASNFWDYPIYLTVCAAIYLYTNLRAYNYSFESVTISFVQVVLTAILAYGVALPFHLNFELISSEIKIVETNSRFYQLLVLWGYQSAFFVMLLLAVIADFKLGGQLFNPIRTQGNKRLPPLEPAALNVAVIKDKKSKLAEFLEKTNPADIIVLILFCCAIGLVIIPEIIYVKDIYPTSPRANTMFKLTYQSFIMFGIAVGYTFTRLLPNRKDKNMHLRDWCTIFGTILVICALIYPFYAIGAWYGNQHFSQYEGLDGIAYMPTHVDDLSEITGAPTGEDINNSEYVFDGDLDIIRYINKNIKGQPVIAEANHLAYTSFGRVASYTGCPDIFNWYTHQQLWRGENHEAFNERVNDNYALYTAADATAALSVIKKYNVEYIMVGRLERAKYAEINVDTLKSLGTTETQSGGAYLIKVEQPAINSAS